MDSPSTPQAPTGRCQELRERPINTLAQQLQSCTISKAKKREQTTATPASQARPRTQRRTEPGQENDPAHAETGCGVTPSRLTCYTDLQEELSCGICLEICVRPCATPCGHAFCRTCLRQALQHKRQCPKCREVVGPSWQPKVNVALWNTIQLLFPRHAAQAPPPTPPVQQAAAVGPRTRAASSSHAAGGVFASQSQAARQAFRPPRPAGASNSDMPVVRSRRRPQADAFVMPADLQVMLQGMTGSRQSRGTSSQSSQHSSQSGIVQARPRRQPNPFADAAHRLPQHQATSNSSLPLHGDVGGLQDDRRSARRTARNSTHHENSWRSAGTGQDRRQQRAAAAERVHAAIAADQSLQGAAEDSDLQAAVLASLLDDSINAAAAVVSRREMGRSVANAATVNGGRAGRQQQQRAVHISLDIGSDEDYFPEVDVSDISSSEDPLAPTSPQGEAALSLFGRIHSGRSPQQQWAAHEAEDDEWLLHIGALADNLAAGEAANVLHGDGSNSASSNQEAAAEIIPLVGAAVPVQRNHRRLQHTNSVGITHATETDVILDDLEELLGDLEDTEVPVQPQPMRRSIVRSRIGSHVAAGSGVQAIAGPGGSAAITVREAQGAPAHDAARHGRRRGRARVIVDDDIPAATEPAGERTGVSWRSQEPEQEQSSTVGVADNAEPVANTALVAVATESHSDSVQLSTAVAADDVLDVEALTLLPSPEPQPLLARLAVVGNHSSQDQGRSMALQLQQQQDGSSRVLSQMVDQALGGHGSRTDLAAVLSQNSNTSAVDDDDDDFLPARPRRGLTAVAAVSAVHERQAAGPSASRSRGRVGRVVAGLRRGTRSSN